MAPNTSFSIGFDKEIGYVQSMVPNASFSIGFNKEIGDNQCTAPVWGWGDEPRPGPGLRRQPKAQEAAQSSKTMKII